MPASGYQGQVAVAQLNSSGVANSLQRASYTTAGVQFRLSLLTLPSTGTGLQPTLYALANQIQTQFTNNPTAAPPTASLSKLRNGLAHACFGTDTLAGYAANPFAGLPQASSFESYGLIDAQRGAGLITNCEVPVALAYWTQQGIQFVDMWSVRRPVFPLSASEEWPLFSGRRRMAEGLAMFLQFQGQIEDLSSTLGATALGSVAAVNYFYYLPSAGFIPVGNVSPSAGFDYLEFFSNRTYRNPVFIEGTKLNQLLHTAFLYPPIDLSNQEMLWVYQVRENQEAIDDNSSTAPPVYMVFTNGQIAYQGKARYDLNYFNYANYF